MSDECFVFASCRKSALTVVEDAETQRDREAVRTAVRCTMMESRASALEIVRQGGDALQDVGE
eukprot:3541452-Amphidinium_carterae.1